MPTIIRLAGIPSQKQTKPANDFPDEQSAIQNATRSLKRALEKGRLPPFRKPNNKLVKLHLIRHEKSLANRQSANLAANNY